jgi:hypothetical protein
MTATTTHSPDVPVPAGFSADDDWETRDEPQPWRLIWGPQRVIGGDAVEVRLSAMQYADGSIGTDDDDGPAIHVNVCRDWGISTKHAREVVAAILAVADEADRLVAE